MNQEQVRHYLTYDYDTGKFYWKNPTAKRVKAGSEAGTLCKGYVRIYINGKGYHGHTLAILYHYGYYPECVDHINHDTSDNRLSNLRVCSLTENQCNRLLNKNNKSGVKGVYWNKRYQKWSTQVTYKGVVHFCGNYKALSEAKEAVDRKRQELHKEYAFNGVIE
jgi:hypothetical protein